MDRTNAVYEKPALQATPIVTAGAQMVSDAGEKVYREQNGEPLSYIVAPIVPLYRDFGHRRQIRRNALTLDTDKVESLATVGNSWGGGLITFCDTVNVGPAYITQGLDGAWKRVTERAMDAYIKLMQERAPMISDAQVHIEPGEPQDLARAYGDDPPPVSLSTTTLIGKGELPVTDYGEEPGRARGYIVEGSTGFDFDMFLAETPDGKTEMSDQHMNAWLSSFIIGFPNIAPGARMRITIPFRCLARARFSNGDVASGLSLRLYLKIFNIGGGPFGNRLPRDLNLTPADPPETYLSIYIDTIPDGVGAKVAKNVTFDVTVPESRHIYIVFDATYGCLRSLGMLYSQALGHKGNEAYGKNNAGVTGGVQIWPWRGWGLHGPYMRAWPIGQHPETSEPEPPLPTPTYE